MVVRGIAGGRGGCAGALRFTKTLARERSAFPTSPGVAILYKAEYSGSVVYCTPALDAKTRLTT